MRPRPRILPFGMMDLRVFPSRVCVLTDDDGRFLLRFTHPKGATDDDISRLADERFATWQAEWYAIVRGEY